MADENVPAPAPTRSDDQILPFAAWVPIGKSNYVLDLQKKQKNPIFQISVDILQNTNSQHSLFSSNLYKLSRLFLLIMPIWAVPLKKGRKSISSRYTLIVGSQNHYLSIGKLIIYHQRITIFTTSAEEDLRLGNLKFVPKGEEDEVFEMPIPNELISNNIRNALYYNAYLEMVAKRDQKVAAKKEGKKKTASAKQPKSKSATEKSSKPAPASKPKPAKEKPSKPSTAKPPKPKPAKEKSTKATPLQKAEKGKVAKVHNMKSSFQLVDEPDEEPAQPEPESEPEHQGEAGHAHVGGVVIREPVAEATRRLLVVEGKATEKASTGPSAQPQDDTSANIVRDSLSLADAETGVESDKTNNGGDTEILQITEELGEDVDKQVNLEEKTTELDQDQAGSDPGETHESRPPLEQVLMDEDQAGPDPGISRVTLAGPDPEPTHDKFMANLYPKNLDDAYAIGDQFINDKSTDDEPRKLNVEAEVVSMVTVLIYQASSSVPPLSTPVIDISPPKPASSTTQAPIFTAITTTITTTLPPLPQQQSTTESELAERVTTLEKKFSDLKQKNKNLDNTTRNLGSRVFTLEHRDLPHKINEIVCETVKEAVQSGTYKSLLEHVALYEALEASMAWTQRDEFLAEKDKSCKRRHDDQDPPPLLPDLDLSKKKQHDSGASSSS
ncbi:hypothetical protein Tco_1310066 [Tanacetum coccineum]